MIPVHVTVLSPDGSPVGGKAPVCRGLFNVVGPICEIGDGLGLDRLLPESREGDVMLIADAGVFGAPMVSHYNLCKPATELILD